MTDIDTLIQRGAGALLGGALIGGYYDWWRYGPAARRRENELAELAERREEEFTKREAELLAAIDRVTKDGDVWKAMALDLLRATSKLATAVEEKK